jgi:16S rRNA (uracil1498-N3)-methyltransferase
VYIPRIYQNTELSEGCKIVLSSEAANHLIRILRLQLNDEFIVFNGKGGEYNARLIAIKKNEVLAQIGNFNAKEIESLMHLHLGQGISRGEKMDYVIQKAVELGVQYITPLITAKCGVKLSSERWDKKLQHWRAVAIAACEQCGRNQLPEIFEPQSVLDWFGHLQADLKLICQPTVTASLKDYDNKMTSVALLIGPESGLDEKEFALAKEYGFNPLSLGPRVLRTETAAVAAVTAIQVYFGDMG